MITITNWYGIACFCFFVCLQSIRIRKRRLSHMPAIRMSRRTYSALTIPLSYTIMRIGVRWSMWVAMLLISIALCNPTLQRIDTHTARIDSNLLFVIDQSPSMAAEDIGGRSRLAHVTEALTEFVEQFPTNRYALVGFGSNAALRVPFTQQYTHMQAQLAEMTIGEFGIGSAIGLALAHALQTVTRFPDQEYRILLFSDGHQSDALINPERIAHAAATLNIPIDTFALGGDVEAPFQYVDADNTIYVSKTKAGVNQALLQSISDMSNGVYFRIRSSSALVQILTFQNQRYASQFTISQRTAPRSQNIVWYFLNGALLLIALSLLLYVFGIGFFFDD